MLQTIKANISIKSAYNTYKSSNMTTLNDLYNTYSYAKLRAYNYCRNLYDTLNGYDFRIIGGNCMTFSVGFKYHDTTTGEEMFVWITKTYDRQISLRELENA